MSAPAVELDIWRVEGERCPNCLAYPPCPVWLVTDTRACEPYPCRCDPKYGRCNYKYCPCLSRKPEPHLPAAKCCAMAPSNRRRWADLAAAGVLVDTSTTASDGPGAFGGTQGAREPVLGAPAHAGAARWVPAGDGPAFDEDGFVVWPDDLDGEFEETGWAPDHGGTLTAAGVRWNGDGERPAPPPPSDDPAALAGAPRRARREPAAGPVRALYVRRWAAAELTCDCPTPWDSDKRPGGVHCVNCHTNWKSVSVMAMHQRRVTDPCRPPATLVDCGTGRPVVHGRREGAFVVWG